MKIRRNTELFTRSLEGQIFLLQQENAELKNNWKELKNWLEENWKQTQDIWFVKIINKMRELERKSEQNE